MLFYVTIMWPDSFMQICLDIVSINVHAQLYVKGRKLTISMTSFDGHTSVDLTYDTLAVAHASKSVGG